MQQACGNAYTLVISCTPHRLGVALWGEHAFFTPWPTHAHATIPATRMTIAKRDFIDVERGWTVMMSSHAAWWSVDLGLSALAGRLKSQYQRLIEYRAVYTGAYD